MIILFIIAVIAAIAAVGFAIFGSSPGVKILGGAGGAIVAVVLFLISSSYTQERGEAMVIKNFDGTIAREDITPGFELKAPWQEAISFDILNQPATYKGDGTSTAEAPVNGGDIEVRDKQGVVASIDSSTTYNIRPNQVSEIFTSYKDQKVFYSQVVEKEIFAATNEVANTYTTADLRTRLADFSKDVFENTKKRLESVGVDVSRVTISKVVYGAEIDQKFADVTNANTKVVQEEANTKVIQEQAKQKILQAEAEAEANRKLAASLTPEILQQRQLDTLRQLGEKGNTFVVPNGSNPLIQVEKK